MCPERLKGCVLLPDRQRDGGRGMEGEGWREVVSLMTFLGEGKRSAVPGIVLNSLYVHFH